MRPDACAVQHVPRRLQQRGRAQIGALGLRLGHRRRRIDAGHVEPFGAQGCGGGQSGDAAAGNQDVGVVHGTSVGLLLHR